MKKHKERKAILANIPVDLYEKLKKIAKENYRSVSAQINLILKETIDKRDKDNGANSPINNKN
jgi:hypothetical protein